MSTAAWDINAASISLAIVGRRPLEDLLGAEHLEVKSHQPAEVGGGRRDMVDPDSKGRGAARVKRGDVYIAAGRGAYTGNRAQW